MTDKITDSGFVSEEEINACLEKLEAHILYEAGRLARFARISGSAKDFAQELRVTAYRTLKAWRPGAAMPATVARRRIDLRAVDLFRANRRAAAHGTVALAGGYGEGEAVPAGVIREEDIPADPDEMQRVLFRADVRAAVEQLEPGLRAAAEAILATDNLSEAAALAGKSRTAFTRTVLPKLRAAFIEAGFSAESL
jgi:DNA-directed RNA polymerase specialized sigma24 family protein